MINERNKGENKTDQKAMGNKSVYSTEIVFIIDRSGSMSGLEDDTIGGFNSNIEKQKGIEGKAFVSTVLFDNYTEVIHDRVPIENVEPMSRETYYVRGCTALLDAIGGAIHHIGNVHKYARAEDVPEKTLFIIITDGMENASHDYSYQHVKSMIERQQDRYGWEFVFIGADMDAVAEGGRLGIRADRSVRYSRDKRGTEMAYYDMCDMVCEMRTKGSIDAEAFVNIKKDNDERGIK